jgi:hypothetical protein
MAEVKIAADSGGGSVGLVGPASTTSNAALQFKLPVADGSSGQYLKTDGSGNLSWATASGGGGGGDLVYISTQTVSSATTQVEFDLSSTDYDFFMIKAYDCKFTAAPTGGYCVYFIFYDGTYDSSNVGTNRMSLKYQRTYHDSGSIGTSSAWSYNGTLHLSWTPTTSTVFGFNALIGGKTNSPIWIDSAFVDGTSNSGAPKIYGVAPNTSNNMTYAIVKPSTTTFAAGKFLLYGIKNS